jgi:hypothetical protein
MEIEEPGVVIIDPTETDTQRFKNFSLVLLPKLMKLYEGM